MVIKLGLTGLILGNDIVLMVEFKLSKVSERRVGAPDDALGPSAGLQSLVGGVCEVVVEEGDFWTERDVFVINNLILPV